MGKIKIKYNMLYYLLLSYITVKKFRLNNYRDHHWYGSNTTSFGKILDLGEE